MVGVAVVLGSCLCKMGRRHIYGGVLGMGVFGVWCCCERASREDAPTGTEDDGRDIASV